MILIYCAHQEANLALPERKVAGRHAPATHYHVENHFVQIGGFSELAAHDAHEICKIAGYRLATIQEQDAWIKAQRTSGHLAEGSAPHTAVQELIVQEQHHVDKKGRK